MVSVIVPVYNVEKYLPDCIESILKQTYRDFELILVNDGSCDKSFIICEMYLRKDSRVLLINQENQGVSTARNVGLKMAAGRYVIFVDSDDFWDSNQFLEQLVEIAEEKQSDQVMFSMKRCLEDGTLKRQSRRTRCSYDFDLEKDNLSDLIKLGKFNVSAWGSLYRAALLKENNLQFEKDLWSEDIDWTFKVINKVRFISYFDMDAYVYRSRKNSICHKKEQKRCDSLLYIIQKWSKYLKTDMCQKTIRRNMLGVLAYQYYVLLGLLNYIKPQERIHLESIRWVTAYGRDKKTMLCNLSCRIIGEKRTGKLLGKIVSIRLIYNSSLFAIFS